MNPNPFYIGWNKGWSFLFFFEGATPKIEAKGFGISVTSTIKKGETPYERLSAQQQKQLAAQIEQQVLQAYGLLPGTRDQYLGEVA